MIVRIDFDRLSAISVAERHDTTPQRAVLTILEWCIFRGRPDSMAPGSTPDALSAFPAKPRTRRSHHSRLARYTSKGRVPETSVGAAGELRLSPDSPKENRLADGIATWPAGRLTAQAMGVRFAALADAAGWTWGVLLGAIKSGRTRSPEGEARSLSA